MNTRSAEQLEKVLALADSNHDGEALGALRMAKQILTKDGMTFGDLARAALSKPRLGFGLFSGGQVHLEAEIERLAKIVEKLNEEIDNQEEQAEFWRRRSQDLDQQLTQSQAEAERWRKMAREAIEKLWDVGQLAQKEEFDANGPAAESLETTPLPDFPEDENDLAEEKAEKVA